MNHNQMDPMMTKPQNAAPTSAQIREKIAGLDVALADAESDFDKFAGEAVAGVDGAGKRAAEANAKIERLNVERRILERAADKAAKAEAAAAAAAEVEERAKALEAARQNVAKLLDTAQRVDDLIAALKALLPELDATEAAIWGSLRAARVTPPGAVVGRKGLSGHAIDCIHAFAQGRENFRHDKRSTADMAATAWGFLINEVEKEIAA